MIIPRARHWSHRFVLKQIDISIGIFIGGNGMREGLKVVPFHKVHSLVETPIVHFNFSFRG